MILVRETQHLSRDGLKSMATDPFIIEASPYLATCVVVPSCSESPVE
jgi:hypothetical protein